jgi:hypothetical protein
MPGSGAHSESSARASLVLLQSFWVPEFGMEMRKSELLRHATARVRRLTFRKVLDFQIEAKFSKALPHLEAELQLSSIAGVSRPKLPHSCPLLVASMSPHLEKGCY